VLAAAALFNPLRRRVQAVVDRRFDRARYDAERVVERFAAQLREQVDLDILGTGLLGVVDQVLAPSHLGLWLNGPGLNDPSLNGTGLNGTGLNGAGLTSPAEPPGAQTDHSPEVKGFR
jgi:hypothetical protein